MSAAPTHLLGKLIAPGWGQPLTPEDRVAIAKSWISREIAEAALLRRVAHHEGREIVGHKGQRNCAGILFSYYWPGETSAFNHRIRRDQPDWEERKDGQPKQTAKYLGPPRGSNRLYIPPGVTPEQLSDPAIPIAITEGEKKALALWRLANHELESPRFIPIAIAGVWNWRGKVGKTGGPNGEWLDVKGPISDLNRITWTERKVFIVFDTNVRTNDSVNWARKGIARELGSRRAKVDFINLPQDCRVNGIDDLLALWGPVRVLKLFESASSGTRLEVVQTPQFQSRPEGLFRVVEKGNSLTETQLTNFTAEIAANIRLDDGVETKYEFAIAAELFGRRSEFVIPASEFAPMDWAIERLGAAAITYPNKRDYARTAIQSLSLTAEERRVFTHTGWRSVEGKWIFLHAGGAVSCDGPVVDANVRLSGQMSRYELRLPPSPETLVGAVRASLKLLELGPECISFPLLAATYRSVLGETDFAIHLAGETGAFKSEVAALHQQHFGVSMDRLHLPGNWSSTGNALEALAFSGKDALVVIDDFAPHGNASDVSRYHAAADRVFRAAGNHAGRGRLDSSAKLRESKPPRSLILSTGEDIPRGQSIRARLLVVELSKNDVSSAALTGCQRDGTIGCYAEATGAYVQWLAGKYEDTRNSLATLVTEYRHKALGNLGHARTPDIVANLQAGFELFLEFAVEVGAITSSQRDDLSVRCWNALSISAAAQAKHQTANEPATRFVALIQSILAAGRVHLDARGGGAPEFSPGSCGWRRKSDCLEALGECIGWIEDNAIYLEPTASFSAAQLVGRDTGEVLTVSEQTLRRRLNEKGLLASTDTARQTLTVRRTIGGTSRSVLHFLRSTILPEVSDADEEAV